MRIAIVLATAFVTLVSRAEVARGGPSIEVLAIEDARPQDAKMSAETLAELTKELAAKLGAGGHYAVMRGAERTLSTRIVAHGTECMVESELREAKTPSSGLT